ncbi:hypothetical protein [Asaia spathodeae]|uniref:Aspartyl protease n=1 Tax=Asaia spathodeae TaxID=657016 RepID=A0ABX2P7R0_9PROT|nr:hypothetical protein [Asaia spathodeae]
MTIRINIFLGFVLAFLTLGCGGAFADDNSSANYLDLRRCFDFSWTRMHDDRHSRAAIMVLVEINGQRGYMQLDTGAPETALYGAVTDRSGLTVPTQETLKPRRFCSGSYCWALPSLTVDRRKAASDPKLIGHLGLDIFEGRETLLDYPGQHVCTLSGKERNLRVTWSPAVVEAGSLLIPGTIGTTHLDRLLFDTGSGPITVSVFPTTWDVIAGHLKPATPSLSIEGHSYDGALIHVRGNLIAGTVALGPKTLTQPVVYEMPENVRSIVARHGATGVVGDAPFVDQQIILDLRYPARFGVIASASTSAW